MSEAKKIELSAPVTFFGKQVSTVFMREPRAGHVMRLGEPRFPVGQSGAVYMAERDDVIAQYVDELLSIDGKTPVDVGGGALVQMLSLDDGIAVRDALFGFFSDARARTLSKRPTSSPSS
jgi:hypothetical protein